MPVSRGRCGRLDQTIRGSPERLGSSVALLPCPPCEAWAPTSLTRRLQGLSRLYRSSTCLHALQESCLLVVETCAACLLMEKLF